MEERHPTDHVSLLFGVLFTLLGAAFLLQDLPAIPAVDLRWIGPLLVLLAGLWLLVSTVLSSRRRQEAGETDRAEEA